MNLSKKFNGIANTDNKKQYYEEYYGSGGNPVSLGSIWYDAHEIPSIPPTNNTTVVRIIYDADLELVANNAYKLANNSNDLKYAIYGSGCVNSVNPSTNLTQVMTNPYTNESGTDLQIPPPTTIDYFPIIYLADGSIAGPTNNVYIDHYAGLLVFENAPLSTPVRITFHRYIGKLGMAKEEPANWINPINEFKTTVINNEILEPGSNLYYFYITSTDNLNYKAGELYVNYTSTTAVISERILESLNATIPVNFEAEIVNNKLIINLINSSGIYNLYITEKESLIFNKTPISIKLTTLTASELVLSLNKNNLGVLVYYTITDSNTKTIQQAGKLNYVWNSADLITEENPSINFPAINTNVYATFTTSIVNNTFNLYFNNLIGSNIVELKYLTYSMARTITLNNTNREIDFVDRSINGYKIYKYKLDDSLGNTITGEIALICDRGQNVVANYNYNKSIGVGPNADSIGPDFNSITRDVEFVIVESAGGVSLRVDTLPTSGNYTIRFFEKTTDLDGIEVFPSLNPSNIKPSINNLTVAPPANNTDLPYIYTLVTMNPIENSHVYFITASNENNCRHMFQIVVYYSSNNPPSTANPPGTGDFNYNIMPFGKPIGDNNTLDINVVWEGLNPEIRVLISGNTWSFSVCDINMISNYTNLIRAPAGTIQTLDTNLLNNVGNVYYYLIKQGDNMIMKELFLSYSSTGVGLDNTSAFINTPDIGTISNITIEANIVGNVINLNVNNASGSSCDVYLFKNSNSISNLDSILEINESANLNSMVKSKKKYVMDNTNRYLIDEFKENDIVKLLLPTTNNPNKINETLLSKVLHYTIINNGGTEIKTGQLSLLWSNGIIQYIDRFNDGANNNVLFYVDSYYKNNTYLYRVFASNTSVSEIYTINIFPTLILSNVIKPSNIINVNTLFAPDYLSHPTPLTHKRLILKKYDLYSNNSVNLNYLIKDITVANNKKIGSIKFLWDTSSQTPVISEYNIINLGALTSIVFGLYKKPAIENEVIDLYVDIEILKNYHISLVDQIL